MVRLMTERRSSQSMGGPTHYARLDPQPIEVIEAMGLSFHAGSAIKHLVRAGHKGDAVSDLETARWYVVRMVSCLREEHRCFGVWIAQDDEVATLVQRWHLAGGIAVAVRGVLLSCGWKDDQLSHASSAILRAMRAARRDDGRATGPGERVSGGEKYKRRVD